MRLARAAKNGFSALDALLLQKIQSGKNDNAVKVGIDQWREKNNESIYDEGNKLIISYEAMNRNARKPRRANKGKRPCSRIARRAKRRKNGNWRRGH